MRMNWYVRWLTLGKLMGVLPFLALSLGGVELEQAHGQKSEESVPSSPVATSSWQAWKSLSDQQAWQLLPEVAQGTKARLPNWVKPIAMQMPRTAAAMLELDFAQRTQGPLDPALKARLRWIIAQANKSEYGMSLASGDLKRVDGNADETCKRLRDPSQWPAADADAYRFVQLLSTDAPGIPDELFENLRKRLGDRGVAAVVLLTAYGNFQDRLLLGLQVPVEEDGPLPPLNVKFVENSLQRTAILPPNNGQDVYTENGQAITTLDKQWTSVSYDQLQVRLEKQRDRKPRLPIPTWDEVKTKLPAEMAIRPTAIRWSLVTYGYAHELAIPWTTMTRTHWAELPSERILEESLFWIQTRAVNCNYCMGHCEMLLEAAGLSQPAIAKRTRLLAETDWSAFPKAEQVAYAFARKLSLTPSQLTAEDYKSLEQEFGTKQAMSIYIWLCRGLYMTRISDGFQLPLERDNVFGGHAPTESKK